MRHSTRLLKNSLHPAEQAREDVAKARTERREQQPKLITSKLVFIDGISVKTNMMRCYGRAKLGQRLVAAVPHGHWKTTTFGGVLRCDGMTAPLTIDGAINGELFRGLRRANLSADAEAGRCRRHGNLRVHKMAGIREAIEAAGAKLLFRPPYSPNLNPIELAFSKLKTLLGAKAVRTVKALWKALGDLCDNFSPAICTGAPITAGGVPFITQPYRFVPHVSAAFFVVSAIFRGTSGVRLPRFNVGAPAGRPKLPPALTQSDLGQSLKTINIF